MSTEQPDADAYGQEPARISHHQHEATAARFTVFQALAAVGIGHEQADDIVAKLEAGAVTGAHTWISENSAPHGSEQRFEDGWHAGVRDVAGYLLRIADTTGRGARRVQRHVDRPPPTTALPIPQKTPAEDSDPAPALDAKDVLAAAERFPWAVAAPGERHWPDGGDFLDVALSAVRPEERDGYIERLEAFVEQHRPAWRRCCARTGRAAGPPRTAGTR
ncbi:hypothetical protein [Streptomyces roseolilacinus]|uniref:hypothetical protein n=1 Tax=Streptomyces roseolilacinus TaxID=66904 RepID=UPI0037F54516